MESQGKLEKKSGKSQGKVGEFRVKDLADTLIMGKRCPFNMMELV